MKKRKKKKKKKKPSVVLERKSLGLRFAFMVFDMFKLILSSLSQIKNYCNTLESNFTKFLTKKLTVSKLS